MFDWLRNRLAPSPVLVGAAPGRLTLPTVLAFSEEVGGEQPAEKPAPPAEAPAEAPAPAAPAPPPTGDAPPAESTTAAVGILGRPMMNFIADMAAVGASVLLIIAWILVVRSALAWQGFFFALGTIVLVLMATFCAKKKNWAFVYGILGAYQLIFVVLQWIFSGGWMHAGYAVLSLLGALIMAAAGVLGVFVFKTDQLDKPWPHGVTIKVPGA